MSAAEAQATTESERTTISASRGFAGIVTDLAKDAGLNTKDFIDRHYLPDAKRRHEKMLRRKLAAHGHDVGGEG